MSKHKLDIFTVLDRLSVKDLAYYDTLQPEEQKSLAPLVLMKWMTGTQDIRQVFFINELVNHLVFPLANHKQLLLQLLMVCSSGNKQRYKWNKVVPKGKSYPIATSVLCKYFDYSKIKVRDVLPILSNEQITDCAEKIGLQTDELKKLKLELKKR